ncbi:MAG: Ig-like domain-containing protein [Synergistaceae bacterium]|nr:Ig-like domain-containing protein [Synergistaceae bacterium]
MRGLTVSGDINVTVTGSVYAGGVAGWNNGSITNCANSGAVIASGGSWDYAGGVAGSNGGRITNCLNVGDVTASGSSNNIAGGVAGYNGGQGTITNCANNGAVIASGGVQNIAGGVAGSNGGRITNCLNVGDVTASGSSNNIAGGVAGYNGGQGTITNCANNGAVIASGGVQNIAGGVAGANDGTITNCGWLNNTASADVGENGGSNPTNVVSLDAAQMNQVVTTVLPKGRNITLSVGITADAFVSYPGTAADMSGYFSVTSSDISPTGFATFNYSAWPGTLEGISEGRATLTASAAIKATDFSTLHSASPAPVSGDTAVSLNCAVTVSSVAVTGVTLDHATLTLAGTGATAQLTATVLPADAANRNVSWSSDNSAVAAVDANGLVTAIAAGTATITVTTEEGAFTASCAVTVSGAPTPTPSGGSSGGCAAGIGAAALLALLPPALRRRKR